MSFVNPTPDSELDAERSERSQPAQLPSKDEAVTSIVEHADLLLNSGDEVLSLTPDEWRKIRKAIGVDTDLLKSALAEAFDWLCPPKGVGAAGDALREYLLRILPLIDMSTNTVLGKSAPALETSEVHPAVALLKEADYWLDELRRKGYVVGQLQDRIHAITAPEDDSHNGVLVRRGTPWPPSSSEKALDGGPMCDDCPPVGYPTNKTRCDECPRRTVTEG